MAVRLRVHALCVEAKVLGEVVDELALMLGHGLEAEAALLIVSGEEAQPLFVRRRPGGVLHVEIQSDVRVGNVVGLVLRVDVEGKCEFAVALEARAFLVALEGFLGVAIAGFGGVALGLLLDPLALAGDDDLVLAGLVFFARLREVTR